MRPETITSKIPQPLFKGGLTLSRQKYFYHKTLISSPSRFVPSIFFQQTLNLGRFWINKIVVVNRDVCGCQPFAAMGTNLIIVVSRLIAKPAADIIFGSFSVQMKKVFESLLNGRLKIFITFPIYQKRPRQTVTTSRAISFCIRIHFPATTTNSTGFGWSHILPAKSTFMQQSNKVPRL